MKPCRIEEAHVVGRSLVQMLSFAAMRKPSMGDFGSRLVAMACERSEQRTRFHIPTRRRLANAKFFNIFERRAGLGGLTIAFPSRALGPSCDLKFQSACSLIFLALNKSWSRATLYRSLGGMRKFSLYAQCP